MGVAAGVGMADCARHHGVVVQHHVVGRAVRDAYQHVTLAPVQIDVVADHRRLPGPFAAFILGAPALGGDQRIDLDAVNVARSAVIQRVMVHVGRDENGVAGLNRVFFAIAEQSAAAFDDVDLMLPLVDVVRARFAGGYLRVGQRAGRRVVIQVDQPGRAGTVEYVAYVSDYRVHGGSLRGLS